MREYTKKEILNKIQETASKSQILRDKTLLDKWTINELVYCLNLIQAREDLMFSIQVDNLGMAVPVELHAPIWIDSTTRYTRVKFVDIETEEITKDVGDECEYVEETDYIYLIIVEEARD